VKVVDIYGHTIEPGALCRDELGNYWHFEKAMQVKPGDKQPPALGWPVLLSRRDRETVMHASAVGLRVLGDSHV